MTPRFETCAIRGGVLTHLIKRRLVVDPDAVETFCGKRGMPWPTTPGASYCRACKVAANDHINEVK